MEYSSILDKINEADYVLLGIGKELYSLDSQSLEDLLNLFLNSISCKNYFIVDTDPNGKLRSLNLNEKRISCPLCKENVELEEKQWDFYNKWLASSLNKKIVIIELGEDFNNPNIIRWPFERITMINQSSLLIRVHKTFYQIPSEINERAMGINISSEQFLNDIVKH